MGRKCQFTDNSARRYVRIEDEKNWEWIRKIAMVCPYKNSFNKIVNDALSYGLPLLYKSLFEPAEIGEAKETKEAKPAETKTTNSGEKAYYMETTRLLKEVIANEIIIKSVVNSIFREREIRTDGTPIGGLLSGGKLDDTPGYLIEYESRLLREAAK